MEGYYNLSPDIWGKIFTDCFSDGYIFCIWYEFIHFSLPHFPLQFIKWVIYQTFVQMWASYPNFMIAYRDFLRHFAKMDIAKLMKSYILNPVLLFVSANAKLLLLNWFKGHFFQDLELPPKQHLTEN